MARRTRRTRRLTTSKAISDDEGSQAGDTVPTKEKRERKPVTYKEPAPDDDKMEEDEFEVVIKNGNKKKIVAANGDADEEDEDEEEDDDEEVDLDEGVYVAAQSTSSCGQCAHNSRFIVEKILSHMVEEDVRIILGFE
jgi:hypothetical protein